MKSHAENVIVGNISYIAAVPVSVSQVAVTAVAVTFDKDQAQEKPMDKSATKGPSVNVA